MIAINAMSAGQSAFVNKQLNTLAPNIMFVSSGQHTSRRTRWSTDYYL